MAVTILGGSFVSQDQLSLEDGLDVEDSDEDEDAAGVDGALLLESLGFAASFATAGLDSEEGSGVDSELDSELLGA
ncbi:MAG TPA: hypothetical protein VGI45_15860 [Terracidiphilus sp.]